MDYCASPSLAGATARVAANAPADDDGAADDGAADDGDDAPRCGRRRRHGGGGGGGRRRRPSDDDGSGGGGDDGGGRERGRRRRRRRRRGRARRRGRRRRRRRRRERRRAQRRRQRERRRKRRRHGAAAAAARVAASKTFDPASHDGDRSGTGHGSSARTRPDSSCADGECSHAASATVAVDRGPDDTTARRPSASATTSAHVCRRRGYKVPPRATTASPQHRVHHYRARVGWLRGWLWLVCCPERQEARSTRLEKLTPRSLPLAVGH